MAARSRGGSTVRRAGPGPKFAGGRPSGRPWNFSRASTLTCCTLTNLCSQPAVFTAEASNSAAIAGYTTHRHRWEVAGLPLLVDDCLLTTDVLSRSPTPAGARGPGQVPSTGYDRPMVTAEPTGRSLRLLPYVAI